MEFETSAKEGISYKAPHIQKGYYAGKFVDIKEWTNKEGQLIDAKYGKKVILTFEVYSLDEHGNVNKRVKYTAENGVELPVELPLFIYHRYKDQKTGEERTAFTKNSKITRLFKALGWEFTGTKPIRPMEYIGNWLEINVDDYEKTNSLTEEKYLASVIKDFNEFKGKIPADITKETKKETKTPEKKVEDEVEVEEIKDDSITDLSKDQKEKIENIKKLFDSGEISKEGYDKAVAQIKNNKA